MKKRMSILLALLMTCATVAAGCGSSEPAAEQPAAAETEQTTQTEETEAPEEEVAAEPEKSADTAILAVSFGTSYNDTRDVTIGAVENALAEAYPEYEVRRAFTAQIVIDILEEREKMEVDNVTEALDRAVADGIKNLIVQPTHLMNGLEYDDVMAELAEYEADFDSITVAEPLLTSNEDYAGVISAITASTAEYDNEETAIVFMGHGTHHVSNSVYGILQSKLAAAGHDNYYIGTVEGEGPTFDDVKAALDEGGYKKVVLQPLMVVAGDHANNDMAGDEEGAWKAELEAAGYEVECVLKGLGELEEIQKLYVEHTAKAIEKMNQSEDTAILAVSFGTSFNNNREITVGAVENAIGDAFPQYPVRRAFTSQIIIDVLKERDGLEIDNVQEALDRAVADGIKTLIVQPTHLMNGLEYDDVMAELAEYEGDFEKIVVGEPLLTSDADFETVIKAITDATKAYSDEETAVVFMGHGTHHASNAVYGTLQEKLAAAGHDNYFVGTVEGEGPTFDDVKAALKEGGYKKVVLEPLMVVAGDHANNDMAGDEEGAWKAELEKEGYEVTCLLNGLGEIAGIRDLYVAHTQAAVDSLTK